MALAVSDGGAAKGAARASGVMSIERLVGHSVDCARV
jgi:hypothetical protein